jgi:CHASE2 domain-containing sensor protein
MYAWLFRHLPGPLWARILLAVLLLAAVVVVLFGWVFPAVAPHLPLDDGTVGAASTSR